MTLIWLHLTLVRMAFAQIADSFLEISRESLAGPDAQGLSFSFAGNTTSNVDDYGLDRRQFTCYDSGYSACEVIPE